MAVEVVSEICGSGSTHLIEKCVQCNGYQHRYCMQVVAYAISREWHCYEGQDKANTDLGHGKEEAVPSHEQSSMKGYGNQKKLSWSNSATDVFLEDHPVEEVETEKETESFVPDTSGDEELARKLFVELNRDQLGIPGDGALVILDSDDDNVPAKTEAQPAADEGVAAGSPVESSGKKAPNGDGDSKASDQ